MNKRVAGLLIVGGLAAATFAAQAQEPAEQQPVVRPIPVKELDPLYAQKLDDPAYTFAMLELGMRLGAVTADAGRDDPNPTRASLRSFREQHQKVGAMVPSWKTYFSKVPLDDLEKALNEGADRRTRKRITDRMANLCTACHVKYMFEVQARYRWGDFDKVTVEADRETLTFREIMFGVANGLGAVRNDVANGKFEQASEDYAHAKERFTMMELACTRCHEQPREYFIDSRVKGRFFRISGLIRKRSTDTAAYNKLFNEINRMSCFPCHQVHMPAAYRQEYRRRQLKE